MRSIVGVILSTTMVLAVACAPAAIGAAPSTATPTAATATPGSPSTNPPGASGVAGGSVRGTIAPTSGTLPTAAAIRPVSSTMVWATIEQIALFRSHDGGATWEQRGLPPSALTLGDVSFVNESEGWVTFVGAATAPCAIQPLQLWHTADGGATYEIVMTRGMPNEGCKGSLSFVDRSRGFVTATRPGELPVVHRTLDGGRTWSASAPLPAPTGFGMSAGTALSLSRVQGFGSTLLVAAHAATSRGPVDAVYRSTDGGASWSLAARVDDPAPVAFLTATHWIQLVGSNGARQTPDGGATWSPFETTYSQAAPVAPEVLFAETAVGYATVRGTIQRSVDGGRTWSRIPTPGVR